MGEGREIDESYGKNSKSSRVCQNFCHLLWVLITEIYRVEDDGDLRYLMHHACRV